MNLKLGRGFDSLKGELRGDVLASTDAAEMSVGQKYSFYAHLVENYTELRRALSLSLEAAYGAASGSMNYTDQIEINTTSICLIAQYSIFNQATTVESNRASPEILKELQNLTVSQVFQQIGDQFVDAITYGGNLLIALTFQATDQSDKSRLKAQLGGSVGVFSAKAEFQAAIESAAKHRETRIQISGSGGTAFVAMDLKAALAALEAFPEKVKHDPYPCRYHVSPITAVLAGSSLPSGEVPRVGRQYNWLIEAANAFDELSDTSRTWKWLKELPASAFADPPKVRDLAFEKAQTSIKEARERVRNAVMDVQSNIAFAPPRPEKASRRSTSVSVNDTRTRCGDHCIGNYSKRTRWWCANGFKFIRWMGIRKDVGMGDSFRGDYFNSDHY